MGGYFALKELGFQLAAGSHVLKAGAVAPLDASEQLIEAARQRAAAIVAKAEEAYRREHRRGFEEGTVAAGLAAVKRLLGESQVLDEAIHRLEHDLAGVVMACVRKLIEDYDERAKAEAILHGALKQMRRERRPVLRVSSTQYEHFRAKVAEIAANYPEVEFIDVVEDPTLVAPQIIVESSIGRVDGNLGQRLEELAELVYRAVARERADAAEAPGGTGQEAA
jgi:type III secretion protein L